MCILPKHTVYWLFKSLAFIGEEMQSTSVFFVVSEIPALCVRPNRQNNLPVESNIHPCLHQIKVSVVS